MLGFLWLIYSPLFLERPLHRPLYFCVAEIGGFTGPLAMGVLMDITGTFTAGAVFLAATPLAISLLTVFLRD